MNTQLRDELKLLLASDSFAEVRNRCKQLIQEFRQVRDAAPVNAGGEEDEEIDAEVAEDMNDLFLKEMNDLIKLYNDKWRAWRVLVEQEEKKNLAIRKDLVDELKDLCENEENIGKAFARIKAIEEKWKEIGAAPKDQSMELQSEYGKWRDQFYHNIRIYKELQENDLKKNYSLRNQVVHELEQVNKVENIKELEGKLRELRTRWDEIGPSPKDHWEQIRDKYYELLRAAFDKVSAHYDELRQQMQVIAEKKKVLLQQLVEAAAGTPDSHKAWDELTTKFKAIQEEWKNAGRAGQKEERELWKEYRTICDAFYESKAAFYNERNQVFNSHKDRKEEIIKKAKSLKESTNWQETTHVLINLQKEWKNIGHAGPKYENRLWREFREACDSFFSAKTAAEGEKEKELHGNAGRKLAFIEEMANWSAPDEIQTAISELKGFEITFRELGDVPADKRGEVNGKFKKTLDELYGKLNVGPVERTMMVFKASIDSLKNDKAALEDEYKRIRKNRSGKEAEVAQIETNLAFFGRSSKGSPMLKQYQDQIDRGKQEIEIMDQQLKLIRKMMA